MEKQNKFIDPEKIISQLDIREGNVVADFGCGTGYFSFPLAKRVSERGTVYSLDVLPQIIETIESQAKLENIKNVVAKRVNLEKENGSGIESDSLDWVILKDVLYQNQNKEIMFQEAKRVLKAGGKILVVEWGEDNLMIGPEKEIRVKREDVLALAKKIGLKFSTDIDAGDFNYGFVLIK